MFNKKPEKLPLRYALLPSTISLNRLFCLYLYELYPKPNINITLNKA